MVFVEISANNDKFGYPNPNLEKLEVTHDLGWWLVEKPMVNFLFAFNELCSLSITVNIIITETRSLAKYAKLYTLCLKKIPTFKLSVTLSNLNRFPKFLHCWKTCEICYKTTQHYPSHLRHVAILSWDIKNSNFVQMFSTYGKMQTNCIFSAPILIPVRA